MNPMSVAVSLLISFRDDDHFSDENKKIYKKVGSAENL